MRRFAVALPALVVVAGLYLIATRGDPHHASPPSPGSPPPARPVATATAPPHAIAPAQTIAVSQTAPPRGMPAVPRPRPYPRLRPHRRPVLTAPRTDCRWRRYRDGALGSDRNCAPGALDPIVVGNTARTICNRAWLISTSTQRVAQATRDRLVIEYQLPGPVTIYGVARVVPIEDGGSPTNPRNLYVLPLYGWGGERTQAVVARQLHSEICAHKLTVSQAARTLEGNWLANRVPVE